MFETIIFLLLVIVLIVLLTFKKDTAKAITLLQAEILQLRQQLAARQDKSTETGSAPATATRQMPVVPSPVPTPPEPQAPPVPVAPVIPAAISRPVPEPIKPEPAEEETKEEALPAAAALSSLKEESLEPAGAPLTSTPADQKQESTLPQAAFTAAPPKERKPTFWEKNPDLEKFIGENLFNKIGIAVLVLGIGFFLKYAIDKQWINEIGRTFIGIVCGGLLIGVAHRLRKTFAPFSSVLIGGGVSVLYFTIAIAFHQYHLISQALAFILAVLITAFTVFLSLAYDRKELAIIAILGGFSAPFLVSTGQGSVPVLFTYILILNIGMLVLAYYKKWNLVNVICYIATVILYGGWLIFSLNTVKPVKPVPYGTGLVFGTLFYFVFFLMNVINNVRNKAKFNFLDIGILITNTFLYYAAGMVIFYQLSGTDYQGLFTALIAIFNCVFAYSLYRSERVDRTLVFLLIGLVLTFASLTAPVQLHGNYITLFWAAETVLLLWLWQKSGIVLMKYVSLIVLGLMSVSLLMDWAVLQESGVKHLLPFINKIFITGVVAIIAVFLLYRLSSKEPVDRPFVLDIPWSIYRRALALMGIALLYMVCILELRYQSDFYFPLLTPVITGTFNYVFAAVLLYKSRSYTEWSRYVAVALAIIGILSYPVYYNEAIIDIRAAVLSGKAPAAWFFIHYLLIASWVWMLYQLYRTALVFDRKDYLLAFHWFASIWVLYLASASLDHLVVYASGKSGVTPDLVLHNTHRVGYAILWGAFAFVLIYLGLRWKSKTVRVISISVFGLTLLKLFIYDFAGLGEGGKIAAFISLGIILLIISFMYQRLKRILFNDDQQPVVPESHD